MGILLSNRSDSNQRKISLPGNLNIPPFLKNKYVVAAIVVVFLLLVWSFISVGSVSADIPVYTVKQDKFSVSLTESGELRAKNSTAVQSPRIRNLKIIYLIPEGTLVNEGEVVAKFDPTEAMQKVQEAESQLEIEESAKLKLVANQKSSMAQMESNLKSSELSYELSKLNLDQMKFEAEAKQQEAKLQHQKNELSFEQVKQEYESKKIIQKSEMNEQEIKIQQKRAELEKAKRELGKMSLHANASGMVVYGTNWSNSGRKFKVGDTPWGGATIIKLPDLSKMESRTYVNEVDVSMVKDSQVVTVRLDAFQDSAFTGAISKVASIGKEKDGDNQIKVFEVNIDLTDTSHVLKPGMTTSNKILINEIDDVMFIPLEAVFDKEDKKIVYVKSGSDFDEVEVELGAKGEDYIVVIKGLEPGDEIALLDPTDEDLKEKTDNQQDANLPNS